MLLSSWETREARLASNVRFPSVKAIEAITSAGAIRHACRPDSLSLTAVSKRPKIEETSRYVSRTGVWLPVAA
jgi:hypothetical protein